VDAVTLAGLALGSWFAASALLGGLWIRYVTPSPTGRAYRVADRRRTRA
jgi:hypothetical protein